MPSEEQRVAVVVRLRDPGAGELQAVLAGFGVGLEPLHPGASGELGSYFTIAGLSSTEADRLTARLRELATVEAAYIQPSASPA